MLPHERRVTDRDRPGDHHTRVQLMTRTRVLALLALVLAVGSLTTRAQPTTPQSRLKALVPEIERNLQENIVPFWFPRSIDRQDGGYTIHYGPKGEPLPEGTKAIVTHCCGVNTRRLASATSQTTALPSCATACGITSTAVSTGKSTARCSVRTSTCMARRSGLVHGQN